MKYELVLFDADGTLFDYQKGEEFALKKAMESFNIDYNEDLHLKEYRSINLRIWKKLERGEITPEKLRSERFRILFEELEIKANAVDFGEKYLYFLSRAAFLIEGALDILDKLKGKIEMVLISNGLADVQNRRLNKSPLRKYFKGFIISGEIGIAKPHPEIFNKAFEKAEHNNRETAIITGDSLTSDIQGGKNFGIDTCWFNPRGLENKTELTPTYEINKLSELEEILLTG